MQNRWVSKKSCKESDKDDFNFELQAIDPYLHRHHQSSHCLVSSSVLLTLSPPPALGIAPGDESLDTGHQAYSRGRQRKLVVESCNHFN